ncbi:MAG: hypothetical protein CSA32_01810 [Desulfobulbus propionicus]|nr:MAG: hypothetical protein CSA32_01810 [Desulfobulbus propionicus]
MLSSCRFKLIKIKRLCAMRMGGRYMLKMIPYPFSGQVRCIKKRILVAGGCYFLESDFSKKLFLSRK